MRRRFIVLWALFIVAVAAVGTSAQVSLYAQGGYSTYALAELNDLIDEINAYRESLGGDHDPMNHLKGGFTVSGGLAFPVANNVALRAGVEYLNLGKSVGTRSNTVLPAVAPAGSVDKSTVTLSSSALGYTLGATYLVAEGNVNTHVTAGVGYYTVSKFFDVSSGGTTTLEVNSSGSGLGFNVDLEGTYAISSNTDLLFGVGYRVLKVNEMKTKDGTVVLGVDGDPLVTDLSGFSLRGGVVYRF